MSSNTVTVLLTAIPISYLIFFFFNDTATTEIYTLSLHDALPISTREVTREVGDIPDLRDRRVRSLVLMAPNAARFTDRSEEHTSELQSLAYLVCRLLLEKKKKSSSDTRSQTFCNTVALVSGAT